MSSFPEFIASWTLDFEKSKLCLGLFEAKVDAEDACPEMESACGEFECGEHLSRWLKERVERF